MKVFKYGTFCSGIEAPSVAWHSLGWQPQFFSEIEPFPCAVLKERFPSVPNIGDMTKYKTTLKDYEPGTIDLVCAGTPCQSFSIAGLRKGMDDPRGNLTLTYLGIIDHLRPRWVVWENVPGVLSSNGGRDFGSFLGGLGQLGYGWAYRVLDAQYIRVESHPFAVPQRRRRVFVVGYLGDWHRAAAVLFERESLRRNSPPSRKTGERTAATLTQSSKASGGPEFSNQELFSQNGDGLITESDYGNITPPLTGNPYGDHESREGLLVLSHGQANAEITEGYSSTLNCNHEQPIIFDELQITIPENRSKCEPGDNSPTLNSGGLMTVAFGHQNSSSQSMSIDEISPSLDKSKTPAIFNNTIRRITPLEAERLQGFPDGHTNIIYKGKPATDTVRYKAIGNSMAVNVMSWIGQRIQLVDSIV